MKLLTSLFAFINGLFGFLPGRASLCGSVTLINASGYSWGIASDETGVNIETFECSLEPEFIEPLPAKDNTRRGEARGPVKLELEMDFEIGGSSGIMAATFFVAFVPVNSVSYFGAPATGIYLNKATVTNGRAGWKKGKASLQAYAGIP